MVTKVMERYKANPNKLPKAISAQKFNDYIKQVFKKAGLDEKGRLETDPAKPLYECVGSHTMRRSLASNFYLMEVNVNWNPKRLKRIGRLFLCFSYVICKDLMSGRKQK